MVILYNIIQVNDNKIKTDQLKTTDSVIPDENENGDLMSDRNLMMINKRKYDKLMNDQINHLKTEKIHKNTLSEQLICELSSKNRTVYDNNISNENSSINSVTNNANDGTNVTVNSMSQDKLQSRIEHDTATSPKLVERQSVNDNNTYHCRNLSLTGEFSSIISPNPHRVLVIDENTDFDDEYERAINLKRKVGSVDPINNVHSKRSTVVTKKNPKNENPEI